MTALELEILKALELVPPWALHSVVLKGLELVPLSCGDVFALFGREQNWNFCGACIQYLNQLPLAETSPAIPPAWSLLPQLEVPRLAGTVQAAFAGNSRGSVTLR